MPLFSGTFQYSTIVLFLWDICSSLIFSSNQSHFCLYFHGKFVLASLETFHVRFHGAVSVFIFSKHCQMKGEVFTNKIVDFFTLKPSIHDSTISRNFLLVIVFWKIFQTQTTGTESLGDENGRSAGNKLLLLSKIC